MEIIEMSVESGATDAEFEQRVRELAYRLWEDDGRQDGRADEYWFIAVRQLGGDTAEESDGSATSGHGNGADQPLAGRSSETTSNGRTGVSSKR